jgi:hypothetical protein
MASSGVIYEEVNGDLSPFSTSDLGEIETPLYKVIIIPFFLFRRLMLESTLGDW